MASPIELKSSSNRSARGDTGRSRSASFVFPLTMRTTCPELFPPTNSSLKAALYVAAPHIRSSPGNKHPAGPATWVSSLSSVKFSSTLPICTYDNAATMWSSSSGGLPYEYPRRHRCRRRGLAWPLAYRLQDAQQHRTEYGGLSDAWDCFFSGTHSLGRGSIGGSLV